MVSHFNFTEDKLIYFRRSVEPASQASTTQAPVTLDPERECYRLYFLFISTKVTSHPIENVCRRSLCKINNVCFNPIHSYQDVDSYFSEKAN